ncbi:helix-turn-helix domain-containing protein [Bacillus cereus]|nr:helix-turn-helix domain-containing protein [Bacillus cereus]
MYLARPNEKYTSFSNEFIWRNDLSKPSKDLLQKILTYPPNFIIFQSEVAERSGIKKQSLTKPMNELKENGFVIQIRAGNTEQNKPRFLTFASDKPVFKQLPSEELYKITEKHRYSKLSNIELGQEQIRLGKQLEKLLSVSL